MAPVHEVAVIDDPVAAAVSLDPVRARLLAELAEPASASMLADTLAMPRQKVNYHLRALERHGLVELVEQRRKGNMTERILRASAASYVISPSVLARVQPDPERTRDSLSARWLVALAARMVRELGELITGAAAESKTLSTFAVDSRVRFASASDRAAFAQELTASVTALISRYHDEETEGGREHRLLLAIHPATSPTAQER